MTREISTDQCSLVLISVLLTCADRPVNGTRSALLNVETCDGFYRAIWTYLALDLMVGQTEILKHHIRPKARIPLHYGVYGDAKTA